MTKNFLEVFPALKLNKEMTALFGQVEVERITSTKRKDYLRIYIISKNLIQKKIIQEIELEILNQLFPKVTITIKIQEKYQLSSQYNPKKLMEVYRDSILIELREQSHVEYRMFKVSKITYPTDKDILLTMEDSILFKGKAGELLRILEKIFVERCGILVGFRVAYEEVEASRNQEESELVIASKVADILSNVNLRKLSDDKEDNPENGDSATDNEKSKGAMKNISKEVIEKPKKQSYSDYRKPAKASNNPDIFYGKDFADETTEIQEIQGEMGEVVIKGKIIRVDKRELRSGSFLFIFDITDFTDTMTVKMFARIEQEEQIAEGIVKGTFIKLKGVTTYDKFDGELTVGSISGAMKISDFTSTRMDNSARKRVELHCHTKMSDMDGVASAKDLINRAEQWGHTALAITDHGIVQAFPEAAHALDKNSKFKVIYGVEAYLVDDLKELVTNGKGQDLQAEFIIFDLETTGFSPKQNRIIEIGAVKIKNGEVIDRFSSFVNPDVPIPFKIENITGINDEMVLHAPMIETVLPEFIEFCGSDVLVAHNASFDMSFIIENARRQKIQLDFTYIDTLGLARILMPNYGKYTLAAVCKNLKISLEGAHRAVNDAEATSKVFIRFIEMLQEENVEDLAQINQLGAGSINAVKKALSYHAIILVQNEIGRVNLYRLISASHLTYYSRRPRIPKSLFMKYREGLIIGSACEAGELYKAVLEGKADSEIAKLATFYDYLEIQPLGNNQFMIESNKYDSIESEEDLIKINRRIVEIGEQFQKPVVATCDVHFLDPEDEVYRRIIMTGKGFSDADNQPPLYLRTTEEMLKEFEYLGSDKAEEVVVTNTNLIADRIEKISPVRADKYAPVIENSDGILTDICYKKAYEMYGNPLPEQVEARLKRELNSIITNGFAVMYIISQKLVWKSIEDGYLVGSRGSVGSSFVATMSGITEVNPLSPHYYCLSCFYNDFESEEVKAFIGQAGCDMPDKICPTCGAQLKKDGFDIPFETFLGFKGDKEPDIDLNFSGEYQSKAHKYTEVIFGEGQTFRAGTIGTLAEKTAFGYVKNYYDERGIIKRNCEIGRIVGGCTGVRRTSGQHPGGIIVLPLGEEINAFTPVQHPANDMKTDIITTHFDYHSIDHNLLKLDILGHDDPTMIRMLEDITGISALEIALDDPQVMSLFRGTDALGITPDQILGCKMGSLGVPEFGTDFVIKMLEDTKPKSFSDLVRISGLSHGTDVWVGNAQTLIEDGDATISTAICTRDDIMTYLIHMGVESSLSFTIMESVRKGKGLNPEWEEAMTASNVPDWYIWSCKKIKYMFPKAHAAAYVMMAWRIAYFKVNYPLAYYASFFSIRASAFSYEMMCQGQTHLERNIKEYKAKGDSLTKKEQDSYKDMKIVQEMYARGFEFLPLDIFSAQARLFQVIEGKIMPSFSSIEGLGEKAADQVVVAAKDGPYLSKDDFRSRTKVSKTVVELMDSMRLFGDIPESNQLSFFDMM